MIKNLELTRFQFAQEEPIIELIDEPILPQEIKKASKLMLSVLLAFIFVIEKKMK